MGQNDTAVAQILHFGPFPFQRKSTKGCLKGGTNLHQIYFLKPRMIWYHIGSFAILFWDEKGLWLGSGGLKCEKRSAKI